MNGRRGEIGGSVGSWNLEEEGWEGSMEEEGRLESCILEERGRLGGGALVGIGAGKFGIESRGGIWSWSIEESRQWGRRKSIRVEEKGEEGEFGVGALRRAGSGEEDWRGGSMEEGHMESWKGEGRRESWHREEGGRRQGVWKLASNRAGECGI